jgi:hypothetical protein
MWTFREDMQTGAAEWELRRLGAEILGTVCQRYMLESHLGDGHASEGVQGVCGQGKIALTSGRRETERQRLGNKQ